VVELGLEKQARFLGYVSAEELRALYRLASFIVFPTLFEGGGLPLYEAFQEGAAVTCSNIPALRGLANNAAVLFDPLSVEDMARGLRQISTDDKLRDALRQKGRERSKLFAWENTAKAYRALYRKLAGQTLSDEDRLLLENPEKV
jgi:glycosyltransferase involved in cell wall biosynthesis